MNPDIRNRYIFRRVFDAAERSVDELKEVVEAEGLPLTIKNGAGQNLAHIAAKHDNVDVLKYVLKEQPRLLDERDVYDISVLHLAVVRNAINSVRYLVEELDADICYLGGQYGDRTALHVAVEFNHLEILKFFVEERNIDFDVPNPNQRTPPLFLTVRHRNWEVIEYLVEEKEANVQIKNHDNENILFPIVRDNFLGFMKYLLDERKIAFDLDWKNRIGCSIMHVAADYGRLEILKYLVDEKFANVNTLKATDQRTPLHFAALRNDFEICEYLIEHGANPSLLDSYGDAPADKARNIKLIDYLEDAVKSRKVRSAPLPYSLLEPIAPPSLESGTPRERIAHASGSGSANEEIKSFPSGNTNWSSFQHLLFLAASVAKVVKGGRDRKRAELIPSPTSILRGRMSSMAIDAVNFRKF